VVDRVLVDGPGVDGGATLGLPPAAVHLGCRMQRRGRCADEERAIGRRRARRRSDRRVGPLPGLCGVECGVACGDRRRRRSGAVTADGREHLLGGRQRDRRCGWRRRALEERAGDRGAGNEQARARAGEAETKKTMHL
jgi:hypothetical protein